MGLHVLALVGALAARGRRGARRRPPLTSAAAGVDVAGLPVGGFGWAESRNAIAPRIAQPLQFEVGRAKWTVSGAKFAFAADLDYTIVAGAPGRGPARRSRSPSRTTGTWSGATFARSTNACHASLAMPSSRG